MTFNEWKNQAIGRHIDVDGYYGAQCVDVYLDYIQKVIGVQNWSLVSGYGDAAALYPKANQAYLTKFDPSGIPQKGDIIFYGPTATNSAGHVAIVDSADSSGVTCIEQDGFNPNGSCYTKFRPWNGRCIGWQRPKNLVISASQGGEIMNSGDVTNMYRVLLGRDPDPSGLAAYTGRTWNDAFYSISGSQEFKNRQQANADLINGLRVALENEQKKPPKEVIKEVEKIVIQEVTKEVPVYTHDEETKQNVNKLVGMVTSIFDYFRGQYKTFSKYIKKG